MTREEQLLQALQLGVQMRNCQRLYFKERTRERLIESKQAEAAFDKAAAELNWGLE